MEKENDMPRNWYNSKDSPLWHKRVYMLWYNMWHRVYHDEYYLGCLIHPSFKYLSNFLEWLEQEPNFEEFKNTCHEVRWSIDKDMKCSGNRNYYPEFMTLCTMSDNSLEVNNRRDYSSQKKGIIGISLKDGSIIIFDSVNESKEKGFNPCNIVNCIKGRQNSHKGYIWQYK